MTYKSEFQNHNNSKDIYGYLRKVLFEPYAKTLVSE